MYIIMNSRYLRTQEAAVCIGQTIDKIVNIPHQSANRQLYMTTLHTILMHKLHYITYIPPHYCKVIKLHEPPREGQLPKKGQKCRFFGGFTLIYSTEMDVFSVLHTDRMKCSNYRRSATQNSFLIIKTAENIGYSGMLKYAKI